MSYRHWTHVRSRRQSRVSVFGRVSRAKEVAGIARPVVVAVGIPSLASDRCRPADRRRRYRRRSRRRCRQSLSPQTKSGSRLAGSDPIGDMPSLSSSASRQSQALPSESVSVSSLATVSRRPPEKRSSPVSAGKRSPASQVFIGASLSGPVVGRCRYRPAVRGRPCRSRSRRSCRYRRCRRRYPGSRLAGIGSIGDAVVVVVGIVAVGGAVGVGVGHRRSPASHRLIGSRCLYRVVGAHYPSGIAAIVVRYRHRVRRWQDQVVGKARPRSSAVDDSVVVIYRTSPAPHRSGSRIAVSVPSAIGDVIVVGIVAVEQCRRSRYPRRRHRGHRLPGCSWPGRRGRDRLASHVPCRCRHPHRLSPSQPVGIRVRTVSWSDDRRCPTEQSSHVSPSLSSRHTRLIRAEQESSPSSDAVSLSSSASPAVSTCPSVSVSVPSSVTLSIADEQSSQVSPSTSRHHQVVERSRIAGIARLRRCRHRHRSVVAQTIGVEIHTIARQHRRSPTEQSSQVSTDRLSPTDEIVQRSPESSNHPATPSLSSSASPAVGTTRRHPCPYRRWRHRIRSLPRSSHRRHHHRTGRRQIADAVERSRIAGIDDCRGRCRPAVRSYRCRRRSRHKPSESKSHADISRPRVVGSEPTAMQSSSTIAIVTVGRADRNRCRCQR